MESIRPPLFDGSNYFAWTIQMSTHLKAFSLWGAVEQEEEIVEISIDSTPEDKKKHCEQTEKKFKAMRMLHQALTPQILDKVLTCQSAKEIWDRLKETYEGNTEIRQIHMRNKMMEFESNRMLETENLQTYFDRTMKLVNEIRALGGKLSEERLIEKAVATLPLKFEAHICAIEECNKLRKELGLPSTNKHSFAEFVGSLLATKKRIDMKTSCDSTLAPVLLIQNAYIVGNSITHQKHVGFDQTSFATIVKRKDTSRGFAEKNMQKKK